MDSGSEIPKGDHHSSDKSEQSQYNSDIHHLAIKMADQFPEIGYTLQIINDFTREKSEGVIPGTDRARIGRNTILLLQQHLATLVHKRIAQWKPSRCFKLCFRMVHNKLEAFIIDGKKIYYADGTLLEHNLFLLSKSKWISVIRELENLINKPDLKEQELQDFLEENPELILDQDYDTLIPQATIISDGHEWRADFVLVPMDQLNFSKVLELKLPKEPIALRSNSGHARFSRAIYRAVEQLKDYHEAFNRSETTEKFKEKYNLPMFKPDLQLFIGRRDSIPNTIEFLELQRRSNVRIKDWDTVVENLRRKFK